MTSAAANEELDAPIDFLHAVSGPMVPEGRKWAEAITALRARVAELEQEAKQMREYFQHNHEVESNLNARAESAESQLRQVKADTERLDWIDENPWVEIECANHKAQQHNRQWFVDQGIQTNERTTCGTAGIRAAIDAARRNDA